MWLELSPNVSLGWWRASKNHILNCFNYFPMESIKQGTTLICFLKKRKKKYLRLSQSRFWKVSAEIEFLKLSVFSLPKRADSDPFSIDCASALKICVNCKGFFLLKILYKPVYALSSNHNQELSKALPQPDFCYNISFLIAPVRLSVWIQIRKITLFIVNIGICYNK